MSQQYVKGRNATIGPKGKSVEPAKDEPEPDVDVMIIPSANTGNCLKRKRERCQIEISAVNVLKSIPGLIDRKVALTSWLQIAREVKANEEIHGVIMNYINNGQTHSYGIQVQNILQVLRAADVGYENNPEWQHGSRMLLWHGTKESALPSILLNGFRLPEPNEQMFGTGIYFADRASKSANYSKFREVPKSEGYLLLCDVLVGRPYHALRPQHTITKAPEGCDSVKGNGWLVPHPAKIYNYKGSRVPFGETVKADIVIPSLLLFYNEYIVYNPWQARPLYLVKFNYVKSPL